MNTNPAAKSFKKTIRKPSAVNASRIAERKNVGGPRRRLAATRPPRGPIPVPQVTASATNLIGTAGLRLSQPADAPTAPPVDKRPILIEKRLVDGTPLSMTAHMQIVRMLTFHRPGGVSRKFLPACAAHDPRGARLALDADLPRPTKITDIGARPHDHLQSSRKSCSQSYCANL